MSSDIQNSSQSGTEPSLAEGTGSEAPARSAAAPPEFAELLKNLAQLAPSSNSAATRPVSRRRFSSQACATVLGNSGGMSGGGSNPSGNRGESVSPIPKFMAPVGAVPANGSAPSNNQWRSRKPGKSLNIGPAGGKVELSLPIQDLGRDEFIANAPRLELDGRSVPALGGIPLLYKLGQGGMGAVYYGIHRGFGHEVAVKVLPFHLAQRDPDSIKRFFREAKLATGIKSEHLVHVTDVAQESGLSYLVMEYIAGKSAAQILKQVRMGGEMGLPERAALDICIAACEGLSAAHAANIIHRDVKPDNILVPLHARESTLNYAGAKVADLGLARNEELSQSMTATNSCLGTPGFMAPEQIENAHDASKPADVWGLGATLYALLAGEAPFTGDAIMAVMRDTIDKPHIPLRARRPDVSKSTCTVVELCLAKDPSNRYEDAPALLRALKACLSALLDPHSAQFLDINRPLLRMDCNRTEIQPAVSSAGAQRKSSRFFKLSLLAGIPAALVAFLFFNYSGAEKADKPAFVHLDVKQLDAADIALDSRIIERERIKNQGLEEVAKRMQKLTTAQPQLAK